MLSIRNAAELSKLHPAGHFAEEMKLATAMQKLALAEPTLRKHLVPLLKEASENWNGELSAFRTASAAYPAFASSARWASMTLFEKVALARKVAQFALMKPEGLTKDAVRAGMAFMVYHIEAEANKSKYYEGLIVPEGSKFRVKRRWGALTDSIRTGRQDGEKFDFDDRFLFSDLGSAKRELRAHFAKRISRGYTDAFGDSHLTPDGRKLPMGEYPVGLDRQGPGFGWGTQSVTKCIPSLRLFQTYLVRATDELARDQMSDVVAGTLEEAAGTLRNVAHEDSTMAAKLLKLIDVSLRRVGGSPRFLPDPEGVALRKELATMLTYVTKQLSLCQ